MSVRGGSGVVALSSVRASFSTCACFLDFGRGTGAFKRRASDRPFGAFPIGADRLGHLMQYVTFSRFDIFPYTYICIYIHTHISTVLLISPGTFGFVNSFGSRCGGTVAMRARS